MKKNLDNKFLTGFTLAELLIASSIFVVITVTIYSSFHTGIFGYRNIEDALDVYQTARGVLGRINLELANSFVYSEQESQFSGGQNEISFLTLVDSYSQGKMRQDYASVSYKLEGDKLMRLCRKNQEALNSKSEILPDEMADNIKEALFSYGYLNTPGQPLEWKDFWDDPIRPPLAIKVKITLRQNKTERDFERTIFLPL